MSAALASEPGVAAFGASLTAIILAAITVLSLGMGFGLPELMPAALVSWLAVGVGHWIGNRLSAGQFIVFSLFALDQALLQVQ